METMTFCVPCLFGLEGLVGDELRRLELSNVRVEDRRVFFEGDFAAMAKANLCCRMGERVMILLSEFDAHSFEDLFQGVKATPLERFIPKDGAFPVKGYSLNSQLHSVPDCQAIVKKAAVTRLGEKYGLGWMPETGETLARSESFAELGVEATQTMNDLWLSVKTSTANTTTYLILTLVAIAAVAAFFIISGIVKRRKKARRCRKWKQA